MQRSVYLAKLIGPICLVIGIGMLINGAVYRTIIGEFLHSYALIYIAGVLGMLGGLALVNAHNEWKAGWPVIITLIGWLALLGGIFRILVPQEAALIGTSMYSQAAMPWISGLIALALGAVLSYFGYAEFLGRRRARTTRKRSRR
jgi:hypothetical protein